MWSFVRASDEQQAKFREAQSSLAYTYEAVGATRVGGQPAGFRQDHHRVLLGRGEKIYQKACDALFSWRMFPSWAEITPRLRPQPGMGISLQFRLLGLYWKSSGRVVYCLDECHEDGTRRCGFAYGTLPGHVECGEELFSVVWYPDDTVTYELIAFSRPQFWMARCAKFLARRWQLRFVRDSQVIMQKLCRES